MTKALFDLSETLRHPSDISSKLQNIEKESKSSYEVHQKKFNSKMSLAYSEVRRLNADYARMGEKIETFDKIKAKNLDILAGFNDLIKDYKLVKTVCLAHQRFLKIKFIMENLKEIDDEITDDDIEVYHSRVYAKEEFMCELEQFNVDIAGEDLPKIEEATRVIKKQSLEFTLFILNVVKDFKENASVLGKVNQIVEQEEERDRLTEQAKEGEKGRDEILKQITRMYPRYITRKPKHLKEQIIGVIKSSIQEKFNLDKETFVTSLDFVLEDIDFIYNHVILNFFTFTAFLEEYHSRLRGAIGRNLDDMDAGEILKLIEFKTSYYTTIESKYNKIAEGLGPKLFDNENELLEKYAKTASVKLSTWIDTITKNEIEKFVTRDSDLSKDEDDKLISTGFINLLQMIKVQLEPISFNKKVFLYITKTVREYCDVFRQRICAEVEKDFSPSCAGKSKPGYEDYCIVFGNSGLKLTQYITSFPQCQSDEVRELGNIFIGILKTCNSFLAKYVVFTCRPATEKLFGGAWDKGISVLLVTLEDFLQDYQLAMADFTYLTFCHELCEGIVGVYFSRIGSKKAVIDSETVPNLKRDHKRLLDLFGTYVNATDLDEIFAPMLKLAPLLETSNDEMFGLELKSLLLSKDGIDQKLIEILISKKTNISEENKKKFTSRMEKVFKESDSVARKH